MESSKIYLQNNSGQFLFMLRDNNPIIPYPDYWDLIGGGEENNETPRQTIERECLEEIGEIPGNIRFLTKLCFPPDSLKPLETCDNIFMGEINTPLRYIKKGKEGQKVGYFHYNQLKDIKFPHFWMDFINDNKELFNIK